MAAVIRSMTRNTANGVIIARKHHRAWQEAFQQNNELSSMSRYITRTGSRCPPSLAFLGPGPGVRKLHRPSPRAAFTLIEVLLVLSIIGVLAAIGWSTLYDDLPRFRLIRAGKGMQADLQNLRMAAIQSNHETRFLLESPDPYPDDPVSYGGSWWLQGGNSSINSSAWEDMPFDDDGDDVDDDRSEGHADLGPGGNRQAKGVGLQQWGAISGPGAGNADAIVFTPRGWVSNPAHDFDSEGYITLKLINKAAMGRGIEDEIHVRVARSGYVRLESTLDPDSSSGTVGTDGSSHDDS